MLALEGVPNLERLNLGGNRLGEFGAARVAGALRVGSVPRLSKLCLGWCQLSPAGAQAVLDALREGGGAQLTDLDLSSSIGDVDRSGAVRVAKAVAAALRAGAAPLLETLDLRGLYSGDLGSRVLRDAVRARAPPLVQPKVTLE